MNQVARLDNHHHHVLPGLMDSPNKDNISHKENAIVSRRRGVTNMMVFDRQASFQPMHKSDSDTVSTCTSSTSACSVSLLPKTPHSPFSITSKALPKKRRVRFADNPVTFAAESPEPMTNEEKAAVFWKPLEYRLFRLCSKRLVVTMVKSDRTKNLQQIYQVCEETEHWNEMWLDTAPCRNLSNSPMRGLEVVACTSLMENRHKAITCVLLAQGGTPQDDSTNPDDFLKSVAQALSRPARRLARILGHSDQAIAEHLQNEEPDTESPCFD
jgi:hypothetical protein